MQSSTAIYPATAWQKIACECSITQAGMTEAEDTHDISNETEQWQGFKQCLELLKGPTDERRYCICLYNIPCLVSLLQEYLLCCAGLLVCCLLPRYYQQGTWMPYMPCMKPSARPSSGAF